MGGAAAGSVGVQRGVYAEGGRTTLELGFTRLVHFILFRSPEPQAEKWVVSEMCVDPRKSKIAMVLILVPDGCV